MHIILVFYFSLMYVVHFVDISYKAAHIVCLCCVFYFIHVLHTRDGMWNYYNTHRLYIVTFKDDFYFVHSFCCEHKVLFWWDDECILRRPEKPTLLFVKHIHTYTQASCVDFGCCTISSFTLCIKKTFDKVLYPLYEAQPATFSMGPPSSVM